MAKIARQMIVPLTAVLMLVGAAPALASQVNWRLNGALLTKSVATQWKGTVKVSDPNKKSFAVAVECEDTAEGSVTTGGKGEITAWAVSKCVNGGECESAGTITLEPVHLPWHTELATVEGTTRDILVSGGSGAPGFKMRCRFLHSNILDECTGTLSTTTTNAFASVTAVFNSSEKLNCAFGGTGVGTIEGSQSIAATSGGRLTAETETLPRWLAAGSPIVTAKAIEWKGTLQLVDQTAPYGELGVSCEDVGSGTAGPGSAGEETKWTMSNCTNVTGSACQATGASIEAMNLSWKSELFTLEGTTHQVVAETGKGTPGFKLKCKTVAGNVTDECLAVPITSMTNTASGVTATFGPEKFTCSQGRLSAAGLTGSQALKLTSGELLHVE